MGKNTFFQFKQFRIEQENSAMKVGVDGVLLGAWADVDGADTILDVGAGTGLIALMLAQRSNAKITAVEIEKNATIEAEQNVEKSPWKERVEVKHLSFQQLAQTTSEKYDLVVSNPPFFSNASKAASSRRTLARHNDSLPFEELIACSAALLKSSGRLAIIVPEDAFHQIGPIAESNGLFTERVTRVHPKPGKAPNRVLVQWAKTECAATPDELTIYESDGNFTPQYVALTRDFYLKF